MNWSKYCTPYEKIVFKIIHVWAVLCVLTPFSLCKNILAISISFLIINCNSKPVSWRIETQQEWELARYESLNLEILEGEIHPKGDLAYFSTKLKLNHKRKLRSIKIEQSKQWNSWHEIPKVTPKRAWNAPVFIPISSGNYWLLAEYMDVEVQGYRAWHGKKWNYWHEIPKVEPKQVEKERMFIPVSSGNCWFLTEHRDDEAQGYRAWHGKKWNYWPEIPEIAPKRAEDDPVFIPVSSGNCWFLAGHEGNKADGYHAWHSEDMRTWKHYGPVSTKVNRWVTSAEYANGKFYIYFDKPNDEDPHLIVDDDLTDGKQGKEVGKVFDDPSHGSDIAIFRDDDGIFHLIYEDWSPINACGNSWDSPLAGHADSPNGIDGFEPHEFPPPIDERSKSTGHIVHYEPDPNQLIPGMDLFPYTYELHQEPQDAFGDYTMIKVGRWYYIFCDYDSHDQNKTMRVGRWRSSDIGKQFLWDGEIGEGFHPDPTVGFAEGKFYLIVQRSGKDFVSEGPWVDGIEVKAGVDTDGDEIIDKWTEFIKIKETYKQKTNFVRVVESIPAVLREINLDYGYTFEIVVRVRKNKGFLPILDVLEINFE